MFHHFVTLALKGLSLIEQVQDELHNKKNELISDTVQRLFKKIRICMRFFRKGAKKGKIFENLGKNVQNWKIFLKRAASCVRLSYA